MTQAADPRIQCPRCPEGRLVAYAKDVDRAKPAWRRFDCGHYINDRPHDATGQCMPVHCHAHGRDESVRDPHLICGECSHVFPTAADLLADYAALAEELNRWGKTDPFAINSPVMLEPKTDPETIHVCPHCAHDF